MIITTAITFFLPEEHEAETLFRKTHESWAVSDSTGKRTYTKITYAEPKEAKVVKIDV